MLRADAAVGELRPTAELADRAGIQGVRIDAEHRRDDGPDDRDREVDDEHDQGEHRDLVAPESRPHDLTEAAADHAP